MSWLIGRFIPAAWLAAFVALAVVFGTPAPPPAAAFFSLALVGLLYCSLAAGGELSGLLKRYSLIFSAALLLVACVTASEWLALGRDPPRLAQPIAAQLGMLLCLPPLALLLRDRARMRMVVAVFAALCLWHLATMPIEAVTGWSLNWHGAPALPRQLGPLNYQAAGLAWQAYYFPGLFLPLFYLACGAILERQVWGRYAFNARNWLLASGLWLVPAVCVQSRSALAGTLAAMLVGWVVQRKGRQPRLWFAAAAIALLGALLFWYLFSQNKSGIGLRLAYLDLYVVESLRWPWILLGHGYASFPDPQMQAPGLQFVHHSHNDFVQVLFSWGLPTLLAYLAFWFGLLKLVYTGFWRRGEYWPALALVAVAPSFITDLGLNHYEKTAFLVLLAGFCLAFAQTEPRPDTAAATPLTPP